MSYEENLYENFSDAFGIIHALARHMEENRRIDTDDISDAQIFRGRKNEIVAKMELVIDENFGGDAGVFRKRLLEQAAKTLFLHAGSKDMDQLLLLEVETWLDAELIESAKLY